jgi:hypothetical protein
MILSTVHISNVLKPVYSINIHAGVATTGIYTLHKPSFTAHKNENNNKTRYGRIQKDSLALHAFSHLQKKKILS